MVVSVFGQRVYMCHEICSFGVCIVASLDIYPRVVKNEENQNVFHCCGCKF